MIAKASANDTINFLEQNLKLNFFKIEEFSINYGCVFNDLPFFNVLETAPNYLINHWNEAKGDSNTLLGLYLPCDKDVLQGKTTNSIILLNQMSGTWTLIHETMHHLFRSRVVTDFGSSDSVFIKRFIDRLYSFEKLYENFKKITNHSSVEIVKLIKKFNQLVPDFLEFIRRWPLEESTIESYLIKKHKSQEFSNLEGKEISGAYAYLISSASRAFGMLEDAYDMAKNIKEIARKELSTADTSYENFLRTKDKIYIKKLKIARFINEKYDEYEIEIEIEINSKKPAAIVSRGIITKKSAKDCSHSKNSKEVEKLIHRALN